MVTTHTKLCPICNAQNHADALFCEECGSSIAGVSTETRGTSSFAAVAPVASDPETNTVQIPVAQQPVSQPYAVSQVSTEYGYVPQTESVRGAVLGWIAFVLMLAIAGFFVWSTLLSDATRDRFTGFF